MSVVCRILPESVVFLYANNRVDEAERVIRHAAKLNNIAMPGSILAARSLEIIVPASKSVSAVAQPNDTICNYLACARTITADVAPTHHDAYNGYAVPKVDNGRMLSNLQRLKRAKEKTVSIKKTRYTLIDVFRNFRLAVYCVSMSFLWSVTVAIYFKNGRQNGCRR